MFCSDVAWNLDAVILRMLLLNPKMLTILILFFFFLPNSFVFVIPRIKSLTGLFLRPPSQKHYHNKQNVGQVDTITLFRQDQRSSFILFDFKTIKSNVTYLARKKLANNGPLHFIVYCYWSFIWFCVFMASIRLLWGRVDQQYSIGHTVLFIYIYRLTPKSQNWNVNSSCWPVRYNIYINYKQCRRWPTMGYYLLPQ